MASNEERQRCWDPRAGEEIEWWEEEEILARFLCRLRELKQIGCTQQDCVALAGRLDIELKRATPLVLRGCPPALAVRVLARA